ncbi:MAG TPA: DUF6498-containing protein [Chitinophagales bacterium]|jgi:hypothetical protein|nr:DUF6498-containing protein [Chitinophagales bacterium]HPH87098.1 DUF6498-containing protein [Chitinophagales bacterium]HPN18171.1 DUF6498-containing protein [Chitinophagales bacterium]
MKHNNKVNEQTANKNVMLPLIIFSNLFPLYGVIHYNWTIFSVVYIYWLELLIISTFQLLKIMFAEGDEEATFFSKLTIALRFFAFRTGIFFFYLIFIVVFLGFLISGKENSDGSGIQLFDVIFLKGNFYKITLLSFLVYNIVEFVVLFLLNGAYKNAKPEDNFIILEPHILVVHLVVVLGTFLYQGATENLHWNHKNAMIATVSLFVVIKIIIDIYRQRLSADVPEDQQGKFI